MPISPIMIILSLLFDCNAKMYLTPELHMLVF